MKPHRCLGPNPGMHTYDCGKEEDEEKEDSETHPSQAAVGSMPMSQQFKSSTINPLQLTGKSDLSIFKAMNVHCNTTVIEITCSIYSISIKTDLHHQSDK